MKRIVSLLCLLAFLLALPFTGLAQQETAEILQLEGVWQATDASPIRHWLFPYSDQWFVSPATEYNHSLARVSLGMALSAFREKNGPMEERDTHIRAYLTSAGFGALQSAEYDVTPTVDTIATLMGHKEIGDFTLLAVAVSGGGYDDEWLSNFTIGDASRHVGFNDASQKVQQRIHTYLSENGITGPVKLWISGYSRAAAVSNITAADMLDSGLFADVFAYTFATPRTTKARGDYAGIFNIVGKFDPVTSVPLGDWGYERYGVDLYTPAQETDSDYHLRVAGTEAVSQQLTGQGFWNNPDINHQLRTLMDFLLTVLPDSAAYTEYMQPILLSVWQDKSVTNIYEVVAQLMEETKLIDQSQRLELDTLLDYLSNVTYTTVVDRVTGATESHWNPEAGLVDNLAHEHVPDVYIAWLFSSDDPEMIFSDKLSYIRFVCSGELDIWLEDEKGYLIWRLGADGKLSYEVPEAEKPWEMESQPVAERPLIYGMRQGDQTIVTLPRDQGYAIMMEAQKTEPIAYFGTVYQLERVRGTLDELHALDVEQDQLYFAFFEMGQREDSNEPFFGARDHHFQLFDEEVPYSPAMVVSMETMNVFHLSFQEMLLVVVAVLLVLLALIIFITVKLVKRRKRRKAQGLSQEKTSQKEATDHAKDA